MKTKYMTVEHPATETLRFEAGILRGRIPVHDLLCNYHWVRLNDSVIFLMGEHPASTYLTLASHPKTVVLPYLHHRKTLKSHFEERQKLHHHAALSSVLPLQDEDTMQELIEYAVAHFGPLFEPKI